jgi:hypothetical protein
LSTREKRRSAAARKTVLVPSAYAGSKEADVLPFFDRERGGGVSEETMCL